MNDRDGIFRAGVGMRHRRAKQRPRRRLGRQAWPQDAVLAVPGEGSSVRADPGRHGGTMEPVRLYLIAQQIFLAYTWGALPTLAGCGLPSIVLFNYWWRWPGALAGAVITAVAAGLAFWMTCRGPRLMEVSDTRLRLVDHRGRECQRFERAEVDAVELLRGGNLWISERSRRHLIALYDVAPRRVLRLRGALERYGWLQPDTDLAAA